MAETNNNTYQLTFLRHGESIGNAEGYRQGHAKFPLTDKGRAQTRALADKWQAEGLTFDYVISSPQPRARETAEIVAAALGLEIEFDKIWMERDNGVLAGLHHEVAQKKYPPKRFSNPYEPTGQTGESEFELLLRGGQAIQGILDRPPGRYLIVSHGGILNKTIHAILGITAHPKFQGPRFRFRNTAYAILEYFPEQHIWHISGVNIRDHWHET